MSGRFFTSSFLMALLVIVTSNFWLNRSTWLGLLIVWMFVGLQLPRYPMWSGKNYADVPGARSVVRSIADERGYYYDTAGLLNAHVGYPMPHHSWAHDGQKQRGESGSVLILTNVGYFGYYAGPDTHIVDIYGIADSFLSRQSQSSTFQEYFSGKNWRIGHFARDIPDGYIESLETGKNEIVNPALAEYWEHLSVVIRGELWSKNRLIEIFRFNSGAYDELIDEYNKSRFVF